MRHRLTLRHLRVSCSLINNVFKNDLKGYKAVVDDVKAERSEKVETAPLFMRSFVDKIDLRTM